MQLRDLAIATVTLVRDAQEDTLLRAALGTLSAVGAPIAIADGGSPAPFRAYLSSLPRVRVAAPRNPGLVGQVTTSLHAAAESGTPFVLYTEPDKHLFFRDHLEAFIGRAASGSRVGAVIAARSRDALATFPAIQQKTEAVINGFTGETVGTPGDYSYGPFLLNSGLVPYMDRVPSELGWGWRHFIFALAARLGYTVAIVEGNYACPEEQRLEDEAERVHRLKQLAQNVQGLVLGTTIATGG